MCAEGRYSKAPGVYGHAMGLPTEVGESVNSSLSFLQSQIEFGTFPQIFVFSKVLKSDSSATSLLNGHTFLPNIHAFARNFP